MRREATNPPPPRRRPDIGGAFKLVDMNGQSVTQAQYAGKNLLIYFGFTYCPDVCPMALLHMGGALDILAESAPQKPPKYNRFSSRLTRSATRPRRWPIICRIFIRALLV